MGLKASRPGLAGHDDPAAYAHKFAGPKYPPDQFIPEKLQAMPGMDADHPLVWTNQYGSGRVYCFTLVGEPLIATGPMLKYFPMNGNCPPTG